jgi:hypothetical protein
MTEEYEEVRVVDHGDHIHEQRVVYDAGTAPRVFAYRLSSIIWLVFGLLIGLIALRVFLKLIAANPASPFAGMLYAFTDIFLWPFSGLTVSPAMGGMVFEIPSVIAMLVYALLAWVTVRIIRFLFYRP